MIKEKVLDKYLRNSYTPLKPLQLFHEAAQRIPAYKDFLKKNHISSSKIN
jgi:hypothetical protein